MAQRPHILLLDPAPDRDGLAARLKGLGAECSVARGLHDAMVQSIIRNPVVIVADLSVPGGAGAECRRRLEALPHVRIPFVTLGPGQDLPGSADDAEVLERVRALLPEAAPAAGGGEPAGAPSSASAPPDLQVSEVMEPHADLSTGDDTVAGALERLRRAEADATLTVRASDGAFGEVMVRGGVPVHAVTTDGAEGDAALAVLAGWAGAEVRVGPPPRPETPVTMAPAAPEGPSPEDARRVTALLEELEALGVVRRTGP
jgi:hypothetical protein